MHRLLGMIAKPGARAIPKRPGSQGNWRRKTRKHLHGCFRSVIEKLATEIIFLPRVPLTPPSHFHFRVVGASPSPSPVKVRRIRSRLTLTLPPTLPSPVVPLAPPSQRVDRNDLSHCCCPWYRRVLKMERFSITSVFPWPTT